MENQLKSAEVDRDNDLVGEPSAAKKQEFAANMDEVAKGLENLSITPHITSIHDLKEIPGLWYKLHVLIHDLRSYQTNSTSRERLELVIDPSYIGSPYFQPTEATMVKSLQVSGNNGSTTLAELIEETLTERLERRMKKRVESGDYRVCAAHDVAPILERGLDVKEKDLMKDKEFIGLVEKWGVELGKGVVWKGIQKKGFATKGKTGKKG